MKRIVNENKGKENRKKATHRLVQLRLLLQKGQIEAKLLARGPIALFESTVQHSLYHSLAQYQHSSAT